MNEDRIVVLTEEKNVISEWANAEYKNFVYNCNHNGYYVNIDKITEQFDKADIETTLKNIRERIIEKEELSQFKSSEDLSDFLYVLEPGTKLHFHVDNYVKSKQTGRHVRFNVCIQKPEQGGRPIYAGRIIDQYECSYVICRSDIDYHASEWISGSKNKIIASFGFMIDNHLIDKYSNREKTVETMCNISSWRINDIQQNIMEEISLLDNHTKYMLRNYRDGASSLENFIYENIRFHSKLVESYKWIEFSLESVENKMMSDYNKKLKTGPRLSILTFFTDCNDYVVCTNVDSEMYKYKEILDDNLIAVSIPKTNTQIVFDSSKYYGLYNNSEKTENKRVYLKINLWDNSESLYSEYIPPPICLEQGFDYKLDISEIYAKSVIDYSDTNLVEKVLYDNDCRDVFEKIIEETKDNMIVVHNINKKHVDFIEIKKIYGELAEDLFQFRTADIISITETNRFYRNKIFQKVLSHDVCYWMINESEKNKWIENLYPNYHNSIVLDTMPHILNFVLFVSKFWLIELRKVYNLEYNNINLNIRDIFITKYTKTTQFIKNHLDNTFFTLKILLNDRIDFKGGELLINNDSIQLIQGDGLFHSGKNICNYSNISEGEQYVLVMFIDIVL